MTDENLIRFYTHTQHDGDCLVWTAARSAKGYGRFSVKIGEPLGLFYSHRWIYQYFHGPLDKGVQVRHKCDNPPCVSLNHLIAGTPAQNTGDMLARNRHPQHMRPKEICQHGHSDWYQAPNGDRRCRVCRADLQRSYRANND